MSHRQWECILREVLGLCISLSSYEKWNVIRVFVLFTGIQCHLIFPLMKVILQGCLFLFLLAAQVYLIWTQTLKTLVSLSIIKCLAELLIVFNYISVMTARRVQWIPIECCSWILLNEERVFGITTCVVRHLHGEQMHFMTVILPLLVVVVWPYVLKFFKDYLIFISNLLNFLNSCL